MTAEPAPESRGGLWSAIAEVLRAKAHEADAIECTQDDETECPGCNQPIAAFSFIDGRPATVFGEPEAFADAVLPVVTAYAERRARERAAEELRAAAHKLDDGADETIEVALGGAAYVHRVLCDRAAALATDDRTGVAVGEMQHHPDCRDDGCWGGSRTCPTSTAADDRTGQR